ncbi:hypothetical protein LX73_0539 [Fodinibius salinus]|uniref:DUF4760 domain-containing protein n=1 Tax=Fodinibius salinus TaxID=860790 RepID=A0A5D3YNI2_9BACT|nr:hypothetical protein [Fodinibius salinus]TYP95242.1 hypothetical protein LX73_0539 [Fodinibius salinus]
MTLSLLLNIATTIAVIIGAYVALRGLGEWKKQLKGNTEYDLARRTLIKTFKVRDAFLQVRNPFMSLKKEEGEEDLVKAEQREFQKRLDKLHSQWSELYVEILETEAIYGRETKNIFQSLIDCKKELESDIWMYFWLKGAYAGPGATVDDNPERVEANRRKVFQQSKDPEKDEITKELNSAVSKIEEFFRPKLKMK